MTQSQYIEALRSALEDLLRELDHAYFGVDTLPASHPARIFSEHAAALVLQKEHS